MAVNRLAFGFLMAVLTAWSRDRPEGLGYPQSGLYTAIWIAGGVALFVDLAIRRRSSPWRRRIALCLDVFGTSFTLVMAGADAAFLAPALYLWITIGNGIRFGNRATFAAAAMSAAGFSAVVVLTPFWRNQIPLVSGVLISLAVVPSYVHVLTRRVARARAEAERANRAKDLFMAGVSHDLRTPLYAISGASELLRETAPTTEQSRMISVLDASARNLLGHVQDLMDFSRLEAGNLRLSLAPFDVALLLGRAIAVVEVQAQAKGLSIASFVSSRTPTRLLGDCGRITNILVNLAGNAVKFTAAGSVKIIVDAEEDAAGQVRLRMEIRDTGIGIAPDAQARLFLDFTREDQESAERAGKTGLGLALCDRLVTLMGGAIGVKSEPAVGSCFWFEIPLDRADSQGRPAAFHAPLTVLGDDSRSIGFASRLSSIGVCIEPPPRAGEGVKPAQIALVDAARVHDAREARGIVVVGDVDQVAALASADDGCLKWPRAYACVPPDASDEDLCRAMHFACACGSAPQPPTPSVKPIGRVVRVLVADDVPTNRMVTRMLLQRSGFTVLSVSDGEAALDALVNGEADVALLDVNLPDIDGVSIMCQYRCVTPASERIPVLALTGDDTERMRSLCLGAGMDDCLVKPVDAERLRAVILSACSGSSVLGHAEPSDPPSGTDSVLDKSVLSRIVSTGGVGFLDDLVRQFDEDVSRLIANIEAAYDCGNLHQVRVCVHALRSGAAAVGAALMSTACSDLEERQPAACGDAGQAGLCAALNEAWSETRPALFGYLGRATASAARPGARSDPE